jgi:hypothetical protein
MKKKDLTEKAVVNDSNRTRTITNEINYVQPSSDDIAERLKTRDLLENKAIDWYAKTGQSSHSHWTSNQNFLNL